VPISRGRGSARRWIGQIRPGLGGWVVDVEVVQGLFVFCATENTRSNRLLADDMRSQQVSWPNATEAGHARLRKEHGICSVWHADSCARKGHCVDSRRMAVCALAGNILVTIWPSNIKRLVDSSQTLRINRGASTNQGQRNICNPGRVSPAFPLMNLKGMLSVSAVCASDG
jgi:hypothetical protein